MYFNRSILSLALLVLVGISAPSVLATGSSADSSENSKSFQIDILLRSQVYLPTPRPIQDVFIVLDDKKTDQVYRIERNQTDNLANLKRETYAASTAITHDPYKVLAKPLGPFPKGSDLGFTLGQWLAGTGTGTYIEEDGNATMNFTFRDLVPNGVYTVHYTRITMPPNYSEDLFPVGAADGSQNSFKADSNGNATFYLNLKALPESTNISFKDYAAMYVTKTVPITEDVTWTLISVAYHSDGQTHGSDIGELGKDSHVQMLHLLFPKPYRTYSEWRNATVQVPATTQWPVASKSKERQPGFESIFALASPIAVAWLMLGRKLL